MKVDNILNLFNQTAIGDILSGQSPKFYQASDFQVELGMYSNGAIISDKTNLTDVVMEIKDPHNLLSSPLITITVLAAAINATITDPQWQDNTSAHSNAIFVVTQAQSDIALQGSTSKQLVAYFWVDTNDVPSKRIPLGQTPIMLLDSGYGDIGALTVKSPGARMLSNVFQIQNADDNLYYNLVLRNVGGVPITSIEGVGGP